MSKFDEYINFIKIHFNEEYDENKCNNEYINNELEKKLKNINDDDNYIDIIIKIGENIVLIFEIDDNGIVKYDDIVLSYVNDDIKIKYYNNYSDNINIIYKDIYKINLSTHDYKIIELCDNIIENEEDRNKGIGTKGMIKLLNFFKNSGYIKMFGKISNVDDLKE